MSEDHLYCDENLRSQLQRGAPNEYVTELLVLVNDVLDRFSRDFPAIFQNFFQR